jgi:hypothetical protein
MAFTWLKQLNKMKYVPFTSPASVWGVSNEAMSGRLGNGAETAMFVAVGTLLN